MKIPVLGMDPSFRNWGLAEGSLDLETGTLDNLHLTLIQPTDMSGKQVRQNSQDIHVAEQLASGALTVAQKAKCVFVECPVGSQSARAMASYGVCVGILGSIRSMGIPLIEVSPIEVKKAFTGSATATKELMIKTAVGWYPDANFPRQKGRIVAKAEHMADAIAAIHAGVNTPMFQNLMRLLMSAQSGE